MLKVTKHKSKNQTYLYSLVFYKQYNPYLPQAAAQYKYICSTMLPCLGAFEDSGSSRGVFSPFCAAEHTAECQACCWASWRKASNKMTRGHLRKCVMRCESVVNMSDPGVLTASALSSLCGLCQDVRGWPAVRAFCPVCAGIHYTHLTLGWNAGPLNKFHGVSLVIIWAFASTASRGYRAFWEWAKK